MKKKVPSKCFLLYQIALLAKNLESIKKTKNKKQKTKKQKKKGK